MSAYDPQAERCVESVKNQTVPFSNIVHIKDVIPESESFNQGLKKVTDKWFMKINGDFILYKDAVERVVKWMESDRNPKIFGYFFPLYDTFLECDIGYCSILDTELMKSVPYDNEIHNDYRTNKRLKKLGYITRKLFHFGAIGTHFDQPDEFQVFRRFYAQAVKFADNSFVINKMGELLEKTGNPLYSVGMKAIEFGKKKLAYPTSKNIDFDRNVFEEFKCELQ